MDAKRLCGRTLATALSLALTFAAVPVVQARTHLVNKQQVAGSLTENAESRQERIALFQKALATPELRAKAQDMGLEAEALSRAIPQLSDQELADLAERATRAQDVVAGEREHRDGKKTLRIIGYVLLAAGIVILAVGTEDVDCCCCCWCCW